MNSSQVRSETIPEPAVPASGPARVAENLQAVPVGQAPVDKFREFLDLKGLKCTGERLAMVRHVFEKHNHFDADQLVSSLKEREIPVSRSTVYRTLLLLVEAGLLRTLEFGSGTFYEHDYGYPHHEHLYCEKCGDVIEFQSEELARLQEEICRAHRFRPTIHKVIIQGVCEKCSRPTGRLRKHEMI